MGNGVAFSFNEVIDVARAVTGHLIPAETCARRAGDTAQLVASLDQVRAALGWDPQYADLHTITGLMIEHGEGARNLLRTGGRL